MCYKKIASNLFYKKNNYHPNDYKAFKIKKKKYLLREAYLTIILKKLYIFYGAFKKINCYILIRKTNQV